MNVHRVFALFVEGEKRRPATIVLTGKLTRFNTAKALEGVEGLDFLWGHHDDTSPEGQALLAANALREPDGWEGVFSRFMLETVRRVTEQINQTAVGPV